MCLVLALPQGLLQAEDTPFRTPSRIIPARPLGFAMATPKVPVELDGFDLLQAGQAVEGVPALFDEGQRLALTLYWRALTDLDATLPIRLQIESSGPTRSANIKLKAAGWQSGGRYVSKAGITLSPAYASGDATLRILIRGAEDQEDATLFAVPLHVRPTPVCANLDLAQLQRVFGAKAIPLGRRFRLGANATLTLPVPESTAPVTALGLVSSLAWKAFFSKGEAVCRVEILGPDDQVQETLLLRHGEHTMQTDYDSYRPGAIEVFSLPVLSETITDSLDYAGKRRIKRQYIGRLPFAEPRRPRRIRLHYLQTTATLHVEELLLIPEHE